MFGSDGFWDHPLVVTIAPVFATALLAALGWLIVEARKARAEVRDHMQAEERDNATWRVEVLGRFDNLDDRFDDIDERVARAQHDADIAHQRIDRLFTTRSHPSYGQLVPEDD